MTCTQPIPAMGIDPALVEVGSSKAVKSQKTVVKVHHLYNDMVIRTNGYDEIQLTMALKKGMGSYGPISITIDTMVAMKGEGNIGLSSDATKVLLEPNAGGASVVSEALSVEYLCRRLQAHSVVPEMKIKYFFSNWKKIDYLTTIRGERIGVSVTRAMGFPTADTFTSEDAERLGKKKLYGLILARSGISECNSYNRSILHVFCQSYSIAVLMAGAFRLIIDRDKQLQHDLEGHIVIILTVAQNIPGIFTEDFTCVTPSFPML